MPPIFKINSETLSVGRLPVCAAKIVRRLSSADELRLRIAPDCAEIPAVGDYVEVFDGQTRKFAGRIEKIHAENSAEKTHTDIVAKNAWRDLESIVYQQSWKRSVNGNVEDVLRSKITLGQNSAGEKITVAEQVLDILRFAISCGAEFAVGVVDADSAMLADEARDLSCAQALARTLKWTPNSSVYFDYSADGLPVLNVRRRGTLETKTISTAAGNVLSATVSPRNDLLVDGVSIKYESEHKINDNVFLGISEEKYPDSISSNAKKTVVMTVDLDGERSSSTSYKIVCGTIDTNSVQWWRRHVPALADETSMAVVESSRSDSTYSRELLSGSIVAAMNFKTLPIVAKAKIKYTKGDGTVVTKNVAANILSTNAASGTYTVWRTLQFAEPRPNGLAKAIFEAVSDLQYEGSLRAVGIDAGAFFGRRINIADSKNPSWADIRTTVSYSEENLFEETALLKFGPPKHLYPDDIEELFRINRNRVVSSDSATRTTAKISSAGGDDTQSKAEINGSEGDAFYERFILSDKSEDDGRNIDLNLSDIKGGETAKMREIYLCYDGYLATAKVLMTLPKKYESEADESGGTESGA